MLAKIGRALANFGNILATDIMTSSRCHEEMEGIVCRLTNGDSRFIRLEQKIDANREALEQKIDGYDGVISNLSGDIKQASGKLDLLITLTKSNGHNGTGGTGKGGGTS